MLDSFFHRVIQNLHMSFLTVLSCIEVNYTSVSLTKGLETFYSAIIFLTSPLDVKVKLYTVILKPFYGISLC